MQSLGKIGGALLIVAFIGGRAYLRTSRSENAETAAAEINKSTPKMLDSETRLDRAVASNSKTLELYHTLVNIDAQDIDPLSFEAAMRPEIEGQLRANPKIDAIRRTKIAFVYHYQGKDGGSIASIRIVP
jgi:hypothetical protein